MDRDSNIKKEKLFDCYKDEDIYLLIKKFEENNFKDDLGKLKEQYNIRIEFRKIDNDNDNDNDNKKYKKYPVNVRFEYHQNDEKAAEEIKKKLKHKIEASEIKKHFIVEKIKKNDNQINDDKNEIMNELMKSNRDISKLTKELKNEREEKELYKSKAELFEKKYNEEREEKELYKGKAELFENKYNKEKAKISIKFISDEENIRDSLIFNKTELFENIKKQFLIKYPDYKNYTFRYKGKILEESKDLNHYNIQDNDEIHISEH